MHIMFIFVCTMYLLNKEIKKNALCYLLSPTDE
jgi:hypothetical protein